MRTIQLDASWWEPLLPGAPVNGVATLKAPDHEIGNRLVVDTLLKEQARFDDSVDGIPMVLAVRCSPFRAELCKAPVLLGFTMLPELMLGHACDPRACPPPRLILTCRSIRVIQEHARLLAWFLPVVAYV